MEAIRSSETSVHIRSTRHHIPEDGILLSSLISAGREVKSIHLKVPRHRSLTLLLRISIVVMDRDKGKNVT
jgi:hypothetical protein